MVKPSSLQAFAHRPALVRSKCGFENRIKNTFFIRSVSAYRELLIAAVLVDTIVQHRTSVLGKIACMCSKTSRVKHTKSVHNRPKTAVFVRTALGLSSNQNEVAINSKSGLWRTALLQSPWLSPMLYSAVQITHCHKVTSPLRSILPSPVGDLNTNNSEVPLYLIFVPRLCHNVLKYAL